MNILRELKKFGFWRDLEDKTKEKIINSSTYKNYTKDTVLYPESSQHHLIYLIISGYVVLSKISSDGKEKYLYYLSDGDLINQCAIDGKVTTTTARVVHDTHLMVIHKDTLLALMEEDFNLCFLLLSSLSLNVRRSQRQILNLGVYNTSQRTISKLLKLSRDYGKQMNGYLLIDAPLNQTDLSHMVGASRESVNRSLKELETKGIISFKGHKIAIIDREKLLDEML